MVTAGMTGRRGMRRPSVANSPVCHPWPAVFSGRWLRLLRGPLTRKGFDSTFPSDKTISVRYNEQESPT
jgi:hypothetical protein